MEDTKKYLNLETVGENIRKYRILNGLSQLRVEELIFDTKNGSVNKWEQGNNIPSAHNLYRLSNIFGCSVDDLLGIPTSKMSFCSAETAELYNKAFDTYGVENQLHVAIEEMSELTKEITKVFRSGELWKPTNGIIEEIADVMIITEELLELFDCLEEVYKVRRYKLKRLENNLRKDGVEV